MAAVIHELWMANDAGAMIMPGSIPLDMPQVRDELVRHLPDTWNSIIDREVDGKDSIPYQKDKANPRYGRILAARRVSRTVMLGSAPSTSALRDQGIRGLETTRILLGAVQPAENIADFKDALMTLHGALSYLYNNPNGNRFWYDTKPTLRKTAEDRASQVSSDDVEMEIENRLKKCRREAPFAGIHVCPASAGDVPDDQAVRLVILRMKDTYRRNYNSSNAMRAVENILNNRGTSPRIFRNMLAFVAPDQDKLGALQQEVKRYIAWTSIMSDKDDLNLDGQQVRETQNNLNRCNTSVEQKLKETYCWLIVPYIDQYEDMKTIQWEVNDLGGGPDSIAAKAAKKMLQGEQIITKWAPALLQMTLDDLLWRDADHIQIKKLWEYLSTYCYLPRLSSFAVLEEAIYQGLASDEYFGLAAAYSNDRYVDLKWNQSVFSVNSTDLLVKPHLVKAQIAKERQNADPQPSWPFVDPNNRPETDVPTGPNGDNRHVDPPAQPTAVNTHFFMSADVDSVRVNKVISTYVDEIIRYLMQVDGAAVDIRLEVDVTAPNGIPATTVRTVSENCKTLKISDFGFDK
jgi:predicted AAA+ superfamily ATPase